MKNTQDQKLHNLEAHSQPSFTLVPILYAKISSCRLQLHIQRKYKTPGKGIRNIPPNAA